VSDSRTRSRADRRRAKEEPRTEKRPLGPELKVVETQVFRGPNYWSYDPAIRLLVDLGSLEDWPSNTIPGVVDGLLEMLPGIPEHSCSLGRRGGFGERPGGDLARSRGRHIALELQRESGAHVYAARPGAPANRAATT
jgi:cyanophycin synthetase